MPSEEQQAAQVEAARTSLKLAFTVLAQIGGLTLAIIIVSLFGGLLLDRLLGTRPLFTILLLLGGFPVSLYVIYRVALNAVAHIKPTGSQPPRAKEERNRDNDA